jgi:hypothetical protein
MNTPGTCRECGCTENNACTHPDWGSCWWLDEKETLCSHCLELKDDPAVTRPRKGRLLTFNDPPPGMSRELFYIDPKHLTRIKID